MFTYYFLFCKDANEQEICMRLCFNIILTQAKLCLCQDVIIVLLYKNLLAIADVETAGQTVE